MFERLILCLVCACAVVVTGNAWAGQGAKNKQLASQIASIMPLFQSKPASAAVLRELLLKRPLRPALLRRLYSGQSRTLRNAIFALKGGCFKGKQWRVLFGKQTWYKCKQKPSKIALGKVARQNVDKLLFAERLESSFGRFVGEWPRRLRKIGRRFCFVFRGASIIQTPGFVIVQSIGKKPCHIESKRVKMRLKRGIPDGEKVKLRGYFRHFVLLHATGSSDMQYIRLFDLKRKKLVMKRDALSGQSEMSLAPDGALLFEQELSFPKACQGKSSYLARERVCWPLLQKKHKALRSVARPKCKCMGGMPPFVIATFRFSLTKASATAQPTSQIKCGCSS